MADGVRRGAVKSIKPWLSEDAWDRLCGLDPNRDRRVRRAARRSEERARGERATKDAAALAALSTRDLASLAAHFGTDKWGTHRYARHYEVHLGHLKREKFTLFEIGIGGYSRAKQGGASLRMWKAFFPNAQIVGLDIQDKSFVNEPRIQAFRGSQTNEPLLRTLVAGMDNLQVVLDDGSHRPEHIRETFRILFPMLPAGGIYIIEDLQTSYWPKWGGSFDRQDPHTSMALVKDLIDGLNYEEWQRDGYEPSYTDENVVAVHCYHNLAIIEKGSNHEGTNRRDDWDQDASASS